MWKPNFEEYRRNFDSHWKPIFLTCRATRMVSVGKYFPFCSPVCCCTAAKQLRVGIGFVRDLHGMTFLPLRKASWIYLSINSIPSRTSAAKFPTILNDTLAIKSPRRINNKVASSSKMSSNVEVSKCSNAVFMLVSHSDFRKALLTTLRPAPVSKRQLSGSSWWGVVPSFTVILYVGLGKV